MAVNEQKSESNTNQPPSYHIRLKGYLTQQWIDWFDGLTVTLEEDGNTLLTGTVVDQSALHGILKKIRDLGMPLLSVNPVDSEQETKTDPNEVKGDS